MQRTTSILALLILTMLNTQAADNKRCAGYVAGEKQVYWGDLHVHSAYSLDAWGFGTAHSPAQAYAFAKGDKITLANGMPAQLERPLDFMAVTDHAEWFNLMYICTDPQWSDDPYCKTMQDRAGPVTGGEVIAEYVLPTITKASPEPTAVCSAQPALCDATKLNQWQRIQQQTEAANAPCEFTTLHGYEWSATPDFSHNHRNIIFRSDAVTEDAVDYLRFSTPEALWRELDRQCLPENDCEAIAIPHNTNMGDSKSFDVETESGDVLLLRARFERLVEIHQEKGSSECLYSFGNVDEDCNFQNYLTLNSRATDAVEFTEKQWEKMRSTYVRSLLKRGIGVYADTEINPLKLGIIGSTDNHAATGGFTEESTWPGTVFGLGDLDRLMTRINWNPGGLVGVWAEENTRAAIFSGLKNRQVFATSGTRVKLNLEASLSEISCGDDQASTVLMGGTISKTSQAPTLKLEALYDRTPIQRIDVIKGEYADGEATEKVITIWEEAGGALNVCRTWQDPDFNPAAPAFWYMRIMEAPVPRWSAHHCRREDRCDDFPGAESTIQERAWSSPIWYLP